MCEHNSAQHKSCVAVSIVLVRTLALGQIRLCRFGTHTHTEKFALAIGTRTAGFAVRSLRAHPHKYWASLGPERTSTSMRGVCAQRRAVSQSVSRSLNKLRERARSGFDNDRYCADACGSATAEQTATHRWMGVELRMQLICDCVCVCACVYVRLSVAEHVDIEEAKSIFETNYSHVYYVLYDTFIAAEGNLRQKGKQHTLIRNVTRLLVIEVRILVWNNLFHTLAHIYTHSL